MIPHVQLEGEQELRRALGELPKKLRNKVLRSALRKAFRPTMKAIAQQLSAHDATGRLSGSLHLRAYKGRGRLARRGLLGVYIATGTRAELGIAPDDPYYYPAVLEFGTHDDRQPARPYMRSTLRRNESAILNRFQQAIRIGMETIVAKELQRLTR